MLPTGQRVEMNIRRNMKDVQHKLYALIFLQVRESISIQHDKHLHVYFLFSNLPQNLTEWAVNKAFCCVSRKVGR